MRIFVIADTHFGHKALADKYQSRPPDFAKKIIVNWKRTVKPEDVIIHLGDVTVGTSTDWALVIPDLPGRKILVLGNHDRKSESWYMSNGFDFCCDNFTWHMFGLDIAFSHEPLFTGQFDLNIHGHLHLNRHREIETDTRHFLFSLENTSYQPLLLETIIKEWGKSNMKSDNTTDN